MGDAIVPRAGSVHQRGQFGEGFGRDEDRAGRQRRARDAIGHPHRNRGGALILLAQPDFPAMSHAALYEDRLPVQRVPGIVNGYVLSVVGGM
jgi:hypothetical protein